jgi:nucleoside-diphosphate-sugar epimerase
MTDFIYMEDVARANRLAAQANATDEVFNVASGVETSLLALARKLLEAIGSNLSVQFGPERAVNKAGAWPTPVRLGSGLVSRRRSARACGDSSGGGVPSAPRKHRVR